FEVVATANFQNGATAVTLPDLTSLPGFFPMAPASTTVTWTAITAGGTRQFFAHPLPFPQTLSTLSAGRTYTETPAGIPHADARIALNSRLSKNDPSRLRGFLRSKLR